MKGEEFKNEIIHMVDKIEDERFLKAIYISMKDFLNEKEEEGKPE